MNKVLLRSTLDRPNLHTLTDLLSLRNAPVLATATLSFSHSASATLHRIAYYQSPSVRLSIPFVLKPAYLIFRFFILRPVS